MTVQYHIRRVDDNVTETFEDPKLATRRYYELLSHGFTVLSSIKENYQEVTAD